MTEKLLGNLGTVMKFAAIIILAGYIVTLSPEVSQMKYDDSGAVHFGYNVISRKAFAGAYVWDGEDETRTILVPERTHGVKITALGGYVDRGVPTPFCVVFPEEYQSYGEGVLGDRATYESVRKEKEAAGVACNLQEIEFTVELGRYVKTAVLTADKYCVRRETDGSVTFTHPVYYFICDEANKTFYSEDGRLYERGTGALVTDYAYAN